MRAGRVHRVAVRLKAAADRGECRQRRAARRHGRARGTSYHPGGTWHGVRGAVRLPALRVARCMPIGTPLIFGQIGSIGTAVLEYSIGIGRIRRPGAQLLKHAVREALHAQGAYGARRAEISITHGRADTRTHARLAALSIAELPPAAIVE